MMQLCFQFKCMNLPNSSHHFCVVASFITNTESGKCYRSNVSSTPRSSVATLPPRNGIRRCSLCKVTRSRWSHDARALMNGISDLIRVPRQLASLCSLPCEDTMRRQTSTIQEVDPPQMSDLYFAAPRLWTLRVDTLEFPLWLRGCKPH